MFLTLEDVRRLTTDVLRQYGPAFDVLAAIPARHGADYSEVMLMMRDCTSEPCRMIIGVRRNTTEEGFRAAFRATLQQRLATSDPHRATAM